jgi:Ala-tRNA(Pro) deacylase
MPVQKLKEFLDRNRIKHVIITHTVDYTAQEIPASAHVAGKELAKKETT